MLVLAPRHPERGTSIQRQLAGHNINAALRSQQQALDTQIYIADTLGELQAWYSHAAAGFIGSSLIKRGEHNMLEAARAGCPTITGLHTFNFTDIVQTLIAEDAMRLAQDATDVVEFFSSVLHDPESFIPMTQRARIQAERSEKVLQSYLTLLNVDSYVMRITALTCLHLYSLNCSTFAVTSAPDANAPLKRIHDMEGRSIRLDHQPRRSV